MILKLQPLAVSAAAARVDDNDAATTAEESISRYGIR